MKFHFDWKGKENWLRGGGGRGRENKVIKAILVHITAKKPHQPKKVE